MRNPKTHQESIANGKVVRTAEHITSTELIVTYTDGTKRAMTTDTFKALHKRVTTD